MKVIDLTHTISEAMPVYPGSEKPKLTTVNTYSKDGFKETLIQIYSHMGTHMDPPAHIFANQKNIGSIFTGTIHWKSNCCGL